MFQVLQICIPSSLGGDIHRMIPHWWFEIGNNYFTEMCSGSEAGSYLRLIDLCITHLWA